MVEINTEREAKQIKYDASLTDSATVYGRYTSANDISTGDAHKNSGFDVVTYPNGYHGSTFVEMLDEAGNVFDSGDISV